MPPGDPRGNSTRSLPRLLLVLAALLLVARAGTGFTQRTPASTPSTVDRVSWVPAAAAEAQSRATGTPLLYEFSAEWCGPCQRMQREVFSDAEAAEEINRSYVPVRLVDRQREEGRNPPDVAALQERYRVEAFPTLVIVPTDGSSPTVVEGYPGKAALTRQLQETAARLRLSHGLGH
jgi:thiol:disulfide interchange protein